MSLFYLGKNFDLQKGQVLDQTLQYDSADLTTHGVVVGMTGSGKTGLCIDFLEEAALAGIPALVVDPKGDLTNLLLHFPNLAPADFAPWIDPDEARRQGKSGDSLAAETADRWRTGLASWGIAPDRVAALQKSAAFTVFTPGSDSGIPISILASLKAPGIAWDGNREVLREKIASTVTALLGLIGYANIDPMRSREYILLANIFESAWSQGKDLDLTELILQTQTPPFEKLGVFPVEQLFPQKDRFDLAILLNNFLAAPAFQSWIEGQPLDIPALLFTPDGRPRHSIFYLSHLDDTERMFFVTLLFAAVEAWMRTQAGTSGLRALIFFDEIAGYLPPVGNPPSKPVMLRMLKQARAFGVGLLLASQNPVDIDYKALANAGTWCIGKLQTDQDKQRLLDGLLSAAGGLDRAEIDRQISALGPRIFLMHDVHQGSAFLFQSRWTMNYLAGPLTRAQIPALNQLGAETEAAPTGVNPISSSIPDLPKETVEKPRTPSPQSELEGSLTRPAAPAGVSELFFPNDLSLSQAVAAAGKTLDPQAQNLGLIYRPALAGQVEVRYLDRRYGINTSQHLSIFSSSPDRRGAIRWEDCLSPMVDPKTLDRSPLPEARFASLIAPLNDGSSLSAIQKDFLDWVYRTSHIRVQANPTLKVYAGPDVTAEQFAGLCSQAAQKAAEAELSKITDPYKRKISAIQDKLSREQRELAQDEGELSQRKMDELGTGVENVLSLFGGRKRRLTTSLTKHRMTQQSKSDVDESRQTIADLQVQIPALEKERDQALQAARDRWAQTAAAVSEITLTPQKNDIFLDFFGLGWTPYYAVKQGGVSIEIKGWGKEP